MVNKKSDDIIIHNGRFIKIVIPIVVQSLIMIMAFLAGFYELRAQQKINSNGIYQVKEEIQELRTDLRELRKKP